MKKQKQTQAAAVPEKSSDKLGTSPKKAETETAINSIDDVVSYKEYTKTLYKNIFLSIQVMKHQSLESLRSTKRR